ncbi:MAG: hypothetical protein HY835_07355, partial [Anaerolineae bacterium]|nr:hypothetical protein [Anaerolineae bacterium]
MAKIIDRLTDKIPWLQKAAALHVPDDLHVGEIDLRFTADREQMEYLCFHVQER